MMLCHHLRSSAHEIVCMQALQLCEFQHRLCGILCSAVPAVLGSCASTLSMCKPSTCAVQLSAALDRVRAGADIMPRKQLEKVLVAELGDSWRQKVADFEYEPLAAASIGQVSMLLDIRVLPAAVIIEPRLAATPCQAK